MAEEEVSMNVPDVSTAEELSMTEGVTIATSTLDAMRALLKEELQRTRETLCEAVRSEIKEGLPHKKIHHHLGDHGKREKDFCSQDSQGTAKRSRPHREKDFTTQDSEGTVRKSGRQHREFFSQDSDGTGRRSVWHQSTPHAHGHGHHIPLSHQAKMYAERFLEYEEQEGFLFQSRKRGSLKQTSPEILMSTVQSDVFRKDDPADTVQEIAVPMDSPLRAPASAQHLQVMKTGTTSTVVETSSYGVGQRQSMMARGSTRWADPIDPQAALDQRRVLASSNIAETRHRRLLEKALGLMPILLHGDHDHSISAMRTMITTFLRHPYFVILKLGLIIVQALLIGLSSNATATSTSYVVPTEYRVVGAIFCSIFTLEALLRIFAYGQRFFLIWGWAWNILDLALVIVAIVYEFLQPLVQSNVLDETSFLRRFLCVCQSVQIARVLHLAKVSDDLRLLLSCLMYSLTTFFWTMAMILMLTYVMAILLTDVSADARRSLAPSSRSFKDLEEVYGSVPTTVLSLYQSFSGGMDWKDLSTPLFEHVSIWWGLWFVLYVCLVSFAVLNLVTAVFVQTGIHRSEVVKEKQKMGHAWKVFQALDVDHSGSISRDEMKIHLEEPQVQAYFESIDLDASEINTLFDILDMNQDGTVNFQEFLNGCLRFQGQAKSLDVLLIMQEMRESFRELSMLVSDCFPDD